MECKIKKNRNIKTAIYTTALLLPRTHKKSEMELSALVGRLLDGNNKIAIDDTENNDENNKNTQNTHKPHTAKDGDGSDLLAALALPRLQLYVQRAQQRKQSQDGDDDALSQLHDDCGIIVKIIL